MIAPPVPAMPARFTYGLYDGRRDPAYRCPLLDAALDFQLPPELEAAEPPEARGLTRDAVRLLVSYRGDNRAVHSQFRSLPCFLDPGDLLVINTSGTMNAALNVSRTDGTVLELHLSTRLPADLWTIELRRPAENSTIPFSEGTPGEILQLAGSGTVNLLTPYNAFQRHQEQPKLTGVRLWIASLNLPAPLDEYLTHYGFPIRYSYVRQPWPIDYYQTVYYTEIGSAEMPSAGRAFTPELITELIARGVQIAPLILHTGVASVEDHEPPYEEYYRVPAETARLVNAARAAGKRVIAVGTTAVRALETVTDDNGRTHPGEGWTRLVITPQRGIRAATGLLTGLHEPQASHLAMLEALAGRPHLRLAYSEALREKYLWHEFGDLHLLLP